MVSNLHSGSTSMTRMGGRLVESVDGEKRTSVLESRQRRTRVYTFVNELLGVDLPTAYQHAFTFIRQLAMILRDALDTKTKEAFRKVYEWKFINSLELWTDAVRAYSSQSDFKHLAYPLTQIISGVARLVPTASIYAPFGYAGDEIVE
ncbi:Nucleolar Complex 2 protein [Trifolium repens]|nr:Nucleolar Complex 2 protein [Trifolium repens]